MCSDKIDEELIFLIVMLVDTRDDHSQHKFDVRKTCQKFQVTLKPNVELKKQRLNNVPVHSKQRLEKLLTQLKDADINREKGNDDDVGSFFVNPTIMMLKSIYGKLVFDARHLNFVTNFTNFFRPLKPVQVIMTEVNHKFF